MTNPINKSHDTSSSPENSGLICRDNDNNQISTLTYSTDGKNQSSLSLTADAEASSSDLVTSQSANPAFNPKVEATIKMHTMRDSYELNVNQILPMLSQKSASKIETIVEKNQLNQSKLVKTKDLTRAFAVNATKISHGKSSENILQKLRKVDADGKQNMLAMLKDKQSSFIEDALKADLEQRKENEEARALNRVKKTGEFSAAFNEQAEMLEDEDLIYKVELKKLVVQNPKKIVAPNHDEAKIDLMALLEANQSDAQFMITQIREKNKNFLEAILD